MILAHAWAYPGRRRSWPGPLRQGGGWNRYRPLVLPLQVDGDDTPPGLGQGLKTEMKSSFRPRAVARHRDLSAAPVGQALARKGPRQAANTPSQGFGDPARAPTPGRRRCGDPRRTHGSSTIPGETRTVPEMRGALRWFRRSGGARRAAVTAWSWWWWAARLITGSCARSRLRRGGIVVGGAWSTSKGTIAQRADQDEISSGLAVWLWVLDGKNSISSSSSGNPSWDLVEDVPLGLGEPAARWASSTALIYLASQPLAHATSAMTYCTRPRLQVARDLETRWPTGAGDGSR